MQVSGEQYVYEKAETESKEVTRFRNSFQELKDLCSQLHQAADYCENTFLNAKQKRIVVDDTREYICRALVTVVDHLGCVSSNLSCSFSKINAISDAELRINCLQQKLLSCEQYAHKLALTRMAWRSNLPRLHRRYLSTPITVEKPNDEGSSDCNSNSNVSLQAPMKKITDNNEFDAEDLPLFMYTYTEKPSPAKTLLERNLTEKDSSNTALVAVRDGLSMGSKTTNPTFHFQQSSHRRGRYSFLRKSVHANDILTRIRRIRRTTL